jgi:hypothetical protein
MGEQYTDLFAAGAYAINEKLLAALAQPSAAWIFYVLTAAGIVVSLMQNAPGGAAQTWVRHLATVAVASILILIPHRFELADLAYASPGTLENLLNTKTGAAPHLTYWVERFGAIVARQVHELMRSQPTFVVPSVVAQVFELTSDPTTLSDPQLRANLQIWRECIAPRLLNQDSDLAAGVRGAHLTSALLNPAPSDSTWVGPLISSRAVAVRRLLAASRVDFIATVADESTLIQEIIERYGAAPWVVGDSSVRLRIALARAPTLTPAPSASFAYTDAVARGSKLALSMIGELSGASDEVEVVRAEELFDLLARGIIYTAGINYFSEDSRLATLGSYCQRLGDAACRSSQGQLISTSAALREPAADRYSSANLTTWFKQPLATLLLTVAALLLGALSSLIVAVLPFLLGVAKAIAILMSSIGLWMMLWPGRLGEAISWMVLPVAFVGLWTFLFGLWSDVEPFLSTVASVVSHSEYGTFSASRIMSLAISFGYLALPAVALSILSGNAMRALNQAEARIASALLLAWRTRRTLFSVGRRWLTNSPLVRRWNQRAYRAVGLGSLRPPRALTPRGQRSTKRKAPEKAIPPSASGAEPARGRKTPAS